MPVTRTIAVVCLKRDCCYAGWRVSWVRRVFERICCGSVGVVGGFLRSGGLWGDGRWLCERGWRFFGVFAVDASRDVDGRSEGVALKVRRRG